MSWLQIELTVILRLNTFQRAELAISLLEIEKQLTKQKELDRKKGLRPNDQSRNTRDIIAKQTDLSSRTLERAKKVIELLNYNTSLKCL